jgi:hypothetical protein
VATNIDIAWRSIRYLALLILSPPELSFALTRTIFGQRFVFE